MDIINVENPIVASPDDNINPDESEIKF